MQPGATDINTELAALAQSRAAPTQNQTDRRECGVIMVTVTRPGNRVKARRKTDINTDYRCTSREAAPTQNSD
jgi:hypothetical protein